MILPKLVDEFGFKEAVFIQQLHFWLCTCGKKISDKLWIYNSYEDWHKQFPFWSISTIKRLVWRLEKQGVLLSNNFNKDPRDKTKWYTLDYNAIGSR